MWTRREQIDSSYLNSEELSFLVDLWKAKPQLWDTEHRFYKSRQHKKEALTEIAEQLGLGWSTEQVKKRLDGLRSYYRELNRKGKAGARGRKVWFLYDKINSFLHYTQFSDFEPDTVDISEIKTESGDDACSGSSFPASASTDCTNDVDLLLQRTTDRDHQASKRSTQDSLQQAQHVQSSAIERPRSTTSSCKRMCLGLNSTSEAGSRSMTHQDDLEEVSVQYFRKMDSLPVMCDPLDRFGQTVVDRLKSISNPKRLAMVKFEIDKVLNQAVLDEMSETD